MEEGDEQLASLGSQASALGLVSATCVTRLDTVLLALHVQVTCSGLSSVLSQEDRVMRGCGVWYREI